MARPRRLSSAAAVRWLALGAVVVGAHLAFINRLAEGIVHTSMLKPMVAPMYTRMITPHAPPAPPPAPAAAQIVPRVAPRARTVAKPPASPAPAAIPAVPATPPQPQPEPVAPQEEAVAQAPVAAASEPTAPPAEDTTMPASASGAPDTSAPTAPADPADSWPRDTRLSYRLSGYWRGELHGDARVLWQRNGTRYQARVEVNVGLLASLSMTSQGEVALEGLMPSAYEEVRNGKARMVRIGEREVMLGNGTIVPRPGGVQDTASQYVELSHRFSTGRETLEVGRAISFWMARPGAVDLWTYDVVAREMLQSARLGAIEAFHLKPRPIANPRGNITAEMWFAPSLQYLPVRIRVNMGDEAYVDLLVDAIEQR